MTLEEALKQVIVLSGTGRLGEAESLAGRVVAMQPRIAQFHNILGNITCRRGNAERGARCIERAILLTPDQGEFHQGLATAILAREPGGVRGAYRGVSRPRPCFRSAWRRPGRLEPGRGGDRLAQAAFLRHPR